MTKANKRQRNGTVPTKPQTPPQKLPIYSAYCDGACWPNPGPGGWAALLLDPFLDTIGESQGGVPKTTNNRMELQAAIEALKLAEQTLAEPGRLVVSSDSLYVINGITGWIKRWLQNEWTSYTGYPVANRDLWEELRRHEEALQEQGFTVRWAWVRGHGHNPWNDRCDEIANEIALAWEG